MACLRRRKECNVLLFDFVTSSCCGNGQDTAGTIGIQGNNAFANDESRTSKVLGGLVNFLARLASLKKS